MRHKRPSERPSKPPPPPRWPAAACYICNRTTTTRSLLGVQATPLCPSCKTECWPNVPKAIRKILSEAPCEAPTPQDPEVEP